MMMVYMVPMVLVMLAMVKFMFLPSISKAEWLDLVDLPTSLAICPLVLFFCKIGPLYFCLPQLDSRLDPIPWTVVFLLKIIHVVI